MVSDASFAETPPPRRQAGCISAKGSGPEEWTRSPLSRPRRSLSPGAGECLSPKPRKFGDEAFLSPKVRRGDSMAGVSTGDCFLSPDRPRGKENDFFSPKRLSCQLQTPGPRTPMPTVREQVPMDPMEAWECGMLRSPAPPGLPEPSVRGTFLTFDSPLRANRLRSPPKSVPANYAPGGGEFDFFDAAPPPPPPELACAPPAWPPCTPETHLFQPPAWEDLQATADVAALPIKLSDFLPDLPLVAPFASFNSCPPPPVYPFTDAVAPGMPATPAVSIVDVLANSVPASPHETAREVPALDVAGHQNDKGSKEQVQDVEQVHVKQQQVAVAEMSQCCSSTLLSCSDQNEQQAEPMRAQVLSLAATMPHPQSTAVEQNFFDHASLHLSQAMLHSGQHMEQHQLLHQGQQFQNQHVPVQIQCDLLQNAGHMLPDHAQSQPEALPVYQHMDNGMSQNIPHHVLQQTLQQLSQQQHIQQFSQDPLQQSFLQEPLQQPAQQVLQQTIMQQFYQQCQGSASQQQLLQHQPVDPTQQHLQEQMQQLQQMMQEREMQHQLQQQMQTQQMERQIQQMMQQMQPPYPQQPQMWPPQPMPVEPAPRALFAPAPLQPAPVKLSELLQLPPMPPHSCSEGSRPAAAADVRESEDAGAPGSHAPHGAKSYAGETATHAPPTTTGVSILAEVLQEISGPETAAAPSAAPRRRRGGRMGPRSNTGRS